jgi:hypothetical protein
LLRGEIICSLSGGLACANRYGGKPLYSAADLRNASDHALELSNGDRAEGERVLRDCRDRARTLLAKPRVWAAVGKLAAALLTREKLSGKEARAVVERAIE